GCHGSDGTACNAGWTPGRRRCELPVVRLRGGRAGRRGRTEGDDLPGDLPRLQDPLGAHARHGPVVARAAPARHRPGHPWRLITVAPPPGGVVAAAAQTLRLTGQTADMVRQADPPGGES